MISERWRCGESRLQKLARRANALEERIEVGEKGPAQV
jgi:hypothetical protein